MNIFREKESARRFAKEIWQHFLANPAKLAKLHRMVDQTISDLMASLPSCRCLISYPLRDEYPIVDRFQMMQKMRDETKHETKQWEQELYLPAILDVPNESFEHDDMEFRRVSIRDLSPDRLVRHRLGFLQPSEQAPKLKLPLNATTDVIILPALAFAQGGFRLGRGKGFYDRFFAKFLPKKNRPSCISIVPEALADLDFPPDAHDLQVDTIVTEVGTCKRNS